MRTSFLVTLLSWTVAYAAVHAQADQTNHTTLPAHLDLKKFPATAVDKVIVPNPNEVFSLMDKLPGHPDWASRVRKDFSTKKSMDRTSASLLFGALIADGFIAVQAKNDDGVKNAGREILALASDLGLQNAVNAHARAIMQACEEQDWAQIRSELDKAHKNIREEMEMMRDEDLAQCVSIAGWIRGTEVLTGLIDEAYSPEKAEILFQPDLAAHFVEELQAMDAKLKTKESIDVILKGLQEVKALMSVEPEQNVPQESVQRIHKICADIGTIIAPKPAN